MSYFAGSPDTLKKQISRGDSLRSVGGQSIGGQSVGGASVASTHLSKGKFSTQTSVQEEPTFIEQASSTIETSPTNTLLHRTPSATS